MKTIKPYTIPFMNYGTITVPAGTRVTNQTAMGKDENYCFVDEFRWVDENYPDISSILKHDLTYYGLNVPKDYVV